MNKNYIKYFAALLLFGSNGVVAAQISLSSREIVLLRTLLGFLLLAAVFVIAKKPVNFLKHKKQLAAIAISGIAMGASWMFLYEAYRLIGVSVASLAYYCGPVLVMALSPVLFKEKLTRTGILCFAAVLIGIFLVNGRAMENAQSQWGLFCGIMSAIMYAGMVIFNKKASDITGLENASLQLLAAFLTVAAVTLVSANGPVRPASGDIIPLLVLGLVNTGLGCYLYFSSIGRLPAQSVAICGYLEPLSALIFSAVFLHETLSAAQIVGAVLILGFSGASAAASSRRDTI